MNCSQLDESLASVESWTDDYESAFVVTMVVLSGVSAALLIYGEIVVRPGLAVVAATAGAVAIYVLSGRLGDEWTCETRLAASAVAAIAASVCALCLLRAGLALLGAASFGVLGHIVFETTPLNTLDAPFKVWDRNAYYYGTIAAFGLVGAVVSHCMKKQFLRLGTSLLGASGVVLVVELVAESRQAEVDPLVHLVTMIGLAVSGVFAQHCCASRRRRRKYTKNSVPPPVGIPVA